MMKFKITLEPSEDGGYTVSVPALPGCISEEESLEPVDAGTISPGALIKELEVWLKSQAWIIPKSSAHSKRMDGTSSGRKEVIFAWKSGRMRNY